MRLYIVMSDTHGAILQAKKCVESFPMAHGIIHLGDYYRDGLAIQRQFPNLEFYSVPGNCDYIFDMDQEEVMEAEGKKIFLTHGHRYNVKYSLNTLRHKALKSNFDAVLFGHTHVAQQEFYSGILFLNPGSLGNPRGLSKPTYALLEISTTGIEARILELDRK